MDREKAPQNRRAHAASLKGLRPAAAERSFETVDCGAPIFSARSAWLAHFASTVAAHKARRSACLSEYWALESIVSVERLAGRTTDTGL
jgi:uncharacterized membrane protein YhhN